eukprot:239866_1
MFLSSFFVLSSIVVINEAQNSNIGYKVRLHDAADRNGAVCLDGGPADFYFAQGEESTKYILFFQGGGWCWNEADCFSRRNTSLGTTKNDASTYNLNKISQLQNSKSANPLMYNWNKAYFRYCDGMSYAGDVTNPIVNANNSSEKMYYRGKRILNAFFESLLSNYSMDKATDVVIGGSSAGGLAVFLHSNYFANNFFNLTQTKLVMTPDVGFFIEYNGYNGKTNWANNMRYIYKMQNISSSIIDPTCFNNKNWNNSECVFAQNIAGDNVIPTFILNSEYDAYQAVNILGTGTSNATLLNEYGYNFTQILKANVLNKNSKNGNIYGGFIDSCYHHDGWNPKYWSDLYIDNITAATAFMEFYNGLEKDNNRVFWYQNESYPCTQCCPNNVGNDDNLLEFYDWY